MQWQPINTLYQLIVLSVYRVVFHPLAKFPGPLQYKLSAWPLLWQAYKGNRHIRHLCDHEKYGMLDLLIARSRSDAVTCPQH